MVDPVESKLALERAKSKIDDDGGKLDGMLDDAKYLLRYAVEAGIEVQPDIAGRIVSATRMGNRVWDSPEAGDAVTAITKLASTLHPVTAETLRGCREDADVAIRSYKRIVYWLAGFIIPLSMVSFIYTSISNTISADLKLANDLAVTLHLQLDQSTSAVLNQAPPSGSVSQLQQFAVAMRAIYSRSNQLEWFVANSVFDQLAGTKGTKDAYGQMEITPNLNANSWVEVHDEVNRLTKIYQEVRLFATNVQDYTSVIWGAISYCFLPVLYGLLGACASVLRAFSQQLEARTFAPSYATPARFIIAGIGGGIVGLFNNFSIGQALSLSPLAVAFLVGYAADIFFSFLEGSMQNLATAKAR
jgi:hypothetical protein